MNERIEKLSSKARDYAREYVADCKQYGYYMEHNEYDLQFEAKFADLIVRDIAAVLRESAEHQSVTGSESEAYILRSHASGIELRYGVE